MSVYEETQQWFVTLDEQHRNHDVATLLNYIQTLKDHALSRANVIDMLGDSNKRWNQKDGELHAAVRTFINDICEVYDDIVETTTLKHLAEAFDIDLETEHEVQITVKYTTTIKAPVGVSRDEIDARIYVEDGVIKTTMERLEIGETFGADDQTVKFTN